MKGLVLKVVKLVYTAFLALNCLTLVIKILSIFLIYGRYLHMGDLFPAFRETEEGQSVRLAFLK